jgi:hypothetical protein
VCENKPSIEFGKDIEKKGQLRRGKGTVASEKQTNKRDDRRTAAAVIATVILLNNITVSSNIARYLARFI